MTNTTTITVETELLQETLIALRDRQFVLRQDIRKYSNQKDSLIAISRRQLDRVTEALNALETALGVKY